MKNKKLIISVFFHAQHGGLHEYVVASIEAALRDGWSVGIVCRDGEFISERIRGLNVEKMAINFEDGAECQRAIEYLSTADLIHTHPGKSREIALQASRISKAPVVMTLHGRWTDAVYSYYDELSCIICVSEAVADIVKNYNIINLAEKLVVIPNGVILNDYSELENLVGYSTFGQKKRTINVISRFDSDKRFLVDLVKSLMQEQILRKNYLLNWRFLGDGAIVGEIEAQAKLVTSSCPDVSVEFLGWIQQDDLLKELSLSDVCIASGRGAMQSLAFGKPTIAAASVGYALVTKPEDLLKAAYSNFGGVGATIEYSVSLVFDQLVAAAFHPHQGFPLSASTFVKENYEQFEVDRKLLSIYKSLL
ncbi:glycosyltransferase family 4 protein [Ochrobactrum sp. MYb379]|uniref:glycosyltransferase family 4 protein n=1 Tax=Ochrobactrum sp. MYb379 TaxID=2745275 RepID=UPI00309B1835